MISGKEMHMKKVPTEPNCDLVIPCRRYGIGVVMQNLTGGESVSGS